MRDVGASVGRWSSSLASLDRQLTVWVCRGVDARLPPSTFNKYYRLLEVSGHGVLWFLLSLAGWTLSKEPHTRTLFSTLLKGVLLDVGSCGLMKEVVRRRRPGGGKRLFAPLAGRFSFPSGHASLTLFLTLFFNTALHLGVWGHVSLPLWALSVSLSRLLVRHHFLMDVLAGWASALLHFNLALYLWPLSALSP